MGLYVGSNKASSFSGLPVQKASGRINITNTEVTDVINYAEAQVVDANLVAENIKKDVTVLGITGTHEGGGSGVIFVDYDGTIVESWDAASVAGKTALPDNPSHDRLVTQGWNWSLADIQDYITNHPKAEVVVCQMYKTASGLTELDITLTKVTGLTVTCNMVGNKDWGDGTQDASTSHTYTDYGDYTITCNGTSIPAGSTTAGGLFGSTTSNIKGHWCTAIRIGENVTSIGDYAFYYCFSLTSITIPNSVTSIGDNAFYYCYALTNITIPNSVTSIGNYTFYDCTSLTSITIPNSVTSISDNAFGHCESLKSIAIPDSVTNIGNYAFCYCYSLTSITISDGATSIGHNAFTYCHSLTSITIPDGVTSIGNSTFDNCASLTSIAIPDGVTSIGQSAFYDCYSLTSITIPDSVTSIDNNAFYYCPSIVKYDFTSATAIPTLSRTNAFTKINAICKIVVPDALYDDWIVATNWATYANYIYKESEVA